MSKAPKANSLIILTLINIFCLTTAFGLSDIDMQAIDADTLRPSQFHHLMAQLKGSVLEKQRSNDVVEAALYEQTEFDVGFYDINIITDYPNQLIDGVVTMTAKSLVSGLSHIELDLTSNFAITAIHSEGQNLNYSRSGDRLIIDLDQPYQIDEEFSVTVEYSGHPEEAGFIGFSFSSNGGDPVISSLSEPYLSRTWWPCKDRNDDKADSVDISITCASTMYCASNGKLIDIVDNGDGTSTFNYAVRYPIVTYLVSVAISNYMIWTDWYHFAPDDSMPIINHTYPDWYYYSQAENSWGATPYIIEVFSDLFGQYPFINEKYGHANFQWGGGMEHQTCTSMGGSSFGFSEPVTVHEASHQWWGDMITCNNWHEIWLNEGFASYSEALYYEVKNGTASYHDYVYDMANSPYGGRGSGPIYVYDTTSVGNIFNSRVYDKGACVLHMLRHIVGDDTFFDILRTYYGSVYQHSDVTTEQFKNLCESISGIELDYFFDEWIYGNLYPIYQFSYYTEQDISDGQYWIYLNIDQTQTSSPQVFAMPLDAIVSYTPFDKDTIVVFNDARSQTFVMKTAQEPLNVDVDPQEWVLKYSSDVSFFELIPFSLDNGDQLLTYMDTLKARGGIGTINYQLSSGSLPEGLSIQNNTGVLSGRPLEYGDFNFTIRVWDAIGGHEDYGDYSMSISQYTGLPGDVDLNGDVNIIDIVQLINYKYKGGIPPEIPPVADANDDCVIDILDIVLLIEYKYKNGNPPSLGCALL